ncbi:MAG: response regulator [Xanthomonadaceae bacterium]|nr:response regulator [Xanthomonadaceae bacterium]
MINIVLVDDHELVRTGFRMILQQQPDIRVGGEAGSAEEGLRLIRTLAPDIALVDVHMPGMSGVELTERVRRAKLSTHIVIVTVVDDARFPKRLLDAGALGYLTKGCNAEELVSAIRQVASGRRYLAPAVAQQLALATLDGSTSPFDVLSSRELEVAMMLVRGKPLTIIGEQLNLSPKTVSTYKQRLMEKLHVDHILGLAHLMTVHGLLDAPNHEVGN